LCRDIHGPVVINCLPRRFLFCLLSLPLRNFIVPLVAVAHAEFGCRRIVFFVVVLLLLWRFLSCAASPFFCCVVIAAAISVLSLLACQFAHFCCSGADRIMLPLFGCYCLSISSYVSFCCRGVVIWRRLHGTGWSHDGIRAAR
jgi:hypothetical protein